MAVTVVLALDPGKTTGWASYDSETGEFLHGQTNFDETANLLARYCLVKEDNTELQIVSESFTIGPQTVKNTQAPWSLELIGVARYFCRTYTGRDLTLQAPAMAKRFSSDGRLKQLGWYDTKQGHANDAARHLLVFCATRGVLPQDVLSKLVGL